MLDGFSNAREKLKSIVRDMWLAFLMPGDFTGARNQFGELQRELERFEREAADKSEMGLASRYDRAFIERVNRYQLGYWRQRAANGLRAIYKNDPNTRDYMLKHLAEAGPKRLIEIVDDALRFEPGLPVDPSHPSEVDLSDPSGKEYFSKLVDGTIIRSPLILGAMVIISVLTILTLGMLGWQVTSVSELADETKQKIEKQEKELNEIQVEIDAKLMDARRIKRQKLQ